MKTFTLASLTITALVILQGFIGTAFAQNCIDPKDTFDDYDDTVKQKSIKDLPPGYYVLSYSWAPKHCAKVSSADKEPGGKDYLQCGSGRDFGYILHGLWPQGAVDNPSKYPKGYPRACEGEQVKIKREVLEPYLCMTPSIDLLQHEYEYHGTCMHDEALETPKAFFDTALALHSTLKLPTNELTYSSESIDWFIEHNPQLKRDSVIYDDWSKEWRVCYDTNFDVMSCPAIFFK